MNIELARIIVCLMADKLDLPSMMLESLEENLVKGEFDKVLDFYKRRLLAQIFPDKTEEEIKQMKFHCAKKEDIDNLEKYCGREQK